MNKILNFVTLALKFHIFMRKIFIVAGDPSGDIHASRLIEAIRGIAPDTRFIGIGGKEMKKAGLDSIAPIEEMSVVGFWEVAKKYTFFKNIFNKCVSIIENEKIDVFIPVDYPGFNIRLANIAKRNSIPVIYYIAPQLWAWGKNRAGKLSKNTDFLLSVFPFEEEYFSKFGIKTIFTGHPLLDNSLIDENFAEYDAREKLIALLPGSRKQEIREHLPLMTRIAERVLSGNSGFKVGISKSQTVNSSIYNSVMQKHPEWSLYENSIELMKKAMAGIVKTGTSNLEAALCGMPFIMIYKTSPVTYFLGKSLINLDYVSLVNILLKRKMISEYIQGDIEVDKISFELIDMLNNREKYGSFQDEFLKIRKMLGGKGASGNAAEIIISFLNSR